MDMLASLPTGTLRDVFVGQLGAVEKYGATAAAAAAAAAGTGELAGVQRFASGKCRMGEGAT
jgi:hypothetical protein